MEYRLDSLDRMSVVIMTDEGPMIIADEDLGYEDVVLFGPTNDYEQALEALDAWWLVVANFPTPEKEVA